MPSSVNEELSAKRRAAGIRGAAARWGNRTSHGKNGKTVAAEDGNLEPRIVTNAASDSADVYIYGEISRWGVSAKDFAAQLAEITATTLNVFINSLGGSVFEGLAILNALRRHEAMVRVTVDGIAASAASFIAMAGDEIVMSRNSQMMIHDALGWIDVFALANPADLAGIIAELDRLREDLERQSNNIAAIYAEAAAARGGSDSAADWRALMTAETWYFAGEAVAAGLADRVDGASAADDPGEPDDAHDAQPRSIESFFKYRGREDAPAPRPLAARPDAPAPTVPTAPAAVFPFDPDMFRKAVKEAAS